MDKCKILNIEKGRITSADIVLPNGQMMHAKVREETYKYLSFQQACLLQYKQVKEPDQYFKRPRTLLKAELNAD